MAISWDPPLSWDWPVEVGKSSTCHNLVWMSPELGLSVKGTMQRTGKHLAGPGRREFVLKSIEVQR